MRCCKFARQPQHNTRRRPLQSCTRQAGTIAPNTMYSHGISKSKTTPQQTWPSMWRIAESRQQPDMHTWCCHRTVNVRKRTQSTHTENPGVQLNVLTQHTDLTNSTRQVYRCLCCHNTCAAAAALQVKSNGICTCRHCMQLCMHTRANGVSTAEAQSSKRT